MPLPEFRKSHVGNPDLYEPMTQLVETIAATTDSGDNADVFYELLATVARLADGAADRSDLERLSDMLKELRTAIDIFAKHADKRKVSIFGSARTKPDEPQYRLAYDVAAAMVEHDWMIMTGGGPGIMTAGMEGGGRANSFGLSIVLPFETEPPEIIARDPKLIDFKYFFTRKLHLVKESDGFAMFPGGFGTMDETFELLTLMQTGQTPLAPVVLMDGGMSYWDRWVDFVRTDLSDNGLISEDDLAMFFVTNDVEEARDEICGFYSTFHSLEQTSDQLVLRLERQLESDELTALNQRFSGLLVSGSIDHVDAHREEIDELERPRIGFHYNQRSAGQLRLLINQINQRD